MMNKIFQFLEKIFTLKEFYKKSINIGYNSIMILLVINNNDIDIIRELYFNLIK